MYKEFYMKPRKVVINIDNGIYAFMDESATGKTYMMNLLDAASRLKLVDALCMTYDSDLSEMEVISKLTDKKYEIIFMDKFDNYITKDICKTLMEIKDTIVLLDLKDLNLLYGIGVNIAFVKLGEHSIEVV
jgi:hypothetical protein